MKNKQARPRWHRDQTAMEGWAWVWPITDCPAASTQEMLNRCLLNRGTEKGWGIVLGKNLTRMSSCGRRASPGPRALVQPRHHIAR